MDWIIAGLGNPGQEYKGHRHNVGFSAVEALRQAWNFPAFQLKSRTSVSSGQYEEQRIVLAQPMAYMNLSGQALGPLVRFYRLPLSRLLIIHDDLDLPVGEVRFKKGGGHGGHNGLKDIHQHIGSEYARIRIGIDHPGSKEGVVSHVLGGFRPQEQPLIQDAIDRSIRALPFLLQGEEPAFIQALKPL